MQAVHFWAFQQEDELILSYFRLDLLHVFLTIGKDWDLSHAAFQLADVEDATG